MDDQEEKEPEMTFWGPEGGKMPEAEHMIVRSAPFWFTGLFTDPTAVFRHELEEGNLFHALIRVWLVSSIYGLLALMLVGFGLSMLNTEAGNELIVNYAINGLVINPIIALIVFLIGNTIIFGLARLFHGSGEFGKQASLFSLFTLLDFVLVILYVLLTVSMGLFAIVLPFISFAIVFLAALTLVWLGLMFFFTLYLQVIAISVAHKMDMLRSLGVVIIEVLLGAAVYLGYIFLVALPRAKELSGA